MRKSQKKPEQKPEYISIGNLAKRWNLSYGGIYNWVTSGKIPNMKTAIGNGKKISWRIPWDWVLEYEKKNYIRPSRKEPKAKAA